MSRTGQLPNLDKLFKDEDDQDFTPLGGSNLAAIFGAPQKLGGDGPSASHKRTSQKKSSGGRSTPQTVQQTPTTKTEVIVAKAVHAYMLQNGQYCLIGKLGIALTGNSALRIYQIILYRSKTEHISVVTLNPEFTYTIRENNYATYYDDKGENWSLHFENEESCVQVAREVGLSRFLSRQTKSDESMMHQDLSVQQRQGLEAKEGDEIIVKTTISWNLTQPLNYNASPTQTVNVEISQDDNWERSLLNCSKGLKRLLFLLPSKQISLGPGFPREKEIIMEIEVIDVLRPETELTLSPPPSSSSSSVTKPPAVTGKASILSRMAKMGQSMLPKVPNSTTTDSEDTEEEVHVKSPRRFKSESSAATKHQTHLPQESVEETVAVTNVLVPKSIVPSSVPLTHTPVMQPSAALASTWAGGAIQQQHQQHQQQYVTMNGQYYPVHQVPVAQTMPVPLDPNINVLLSETRTQNAEIRMGMSKIADNVQKLLDKIQISDQDIAKPSLFSGKRKPSTPETFDNHEFHVLEVQSASTPINERAMETSLKMLMALNATKDLTANGKNAVNTAIHSSGDDGSKVLMLEKELTNARELLDERAKIIGFLESEKLEWSSERNDLCERIRHLEKSLADSNMSLQKAFADLNTANKRTTAYQKDNANLEEKILKLNAEKNILEQTTAVASSAKKDTMTGNDKAAEIKQIMNKTYQTLLAKFTEESYTTEYVKQTVAITIRNITLQVLKEGRVDYESVDNYREAEEKSRDSVLDSKTTAVPSDLSDAVVDSDNDKSSVSLPEVDHSAGAIAEMNIIGVTQEEPPPIPPMDVNTEGGEWVIP